MTFNREEGSVDVRPRSAEETKLLAEAERLLPGGSLGSHRHPPELAFVVRRAAGSKLYDVTGRAYIDYLLGSGPMILGHAHPAVVAAVREAVERGSTYFHLNEPALALAEELVRAIPCAERIRFTTTGSEATFFCLRLARAFTKRDGVLKFEGGYHGSHDYALMSATPRHPKPFPDPTPDSAGIPQVLRGEVFIAPYNDLEATAEILDLHHERIAAVIIEPFQRVIPPAAGFLAGLRDLTRRHGILLVFDEVVTGFRFAYGGAQEYYGVVPDLAAYGKIIGGGYPLGAVAGRAELMAPLDPDLEGTPEHVAQVGTLNGNPIAAAAGLATLRELRRPGIYERLFRTGAELKRGLEDLAKSHGLPARVVGDAPLFDLVFSSEPVTDYRSALEGDKDRLKAFNAELLRRGVLKGAQKIYVSLAHTDEDVARTIEAFDGTLRALAGR